MLADRWRLLDRLFAEAAELPAGERDEFLRGACGPDVKLRNEIAALLVAMEDSGEFLAASALEMFARQVSREGWNVSVGDRIGAYVVERRLGAGGMGEVWRARDERLDRNVAIKLLLPHPSNAGERAFELLRREARAASALNHPNVLTVYDVGEHGGAPYLVTECLEGESLRARLSSSGALSVDAALDVARQVASGLGAAHRQGMVHRDLKPENLFLVAGLTGVSRERGRRSERVKILDFGLATLRLAQEPTPASPAQEPNDSETARSFIAGTAGYMAPEQVRGEIVDPRADVFALGAILHEMVAGRGPFQRESTVATLDAVLTQSPADLSRLNPEVPRDLSRVVLRCLAKDPEERFATATDVAEALDAVVRARNLPPPPGLLATLRRPVVMAIALALVLGIAAGGWRWRSTTKRAHWARAVAAPEVRKLLNHGDYPEAFVLTLRALEAVPEDPLLGQLWREVSNLAAVNTDPPGADVAVAPYRGPSATWHSLGRTPLQGVRIPRGFFRIRVSKPGYRTIEGTGAPGAIQRYRLDLVDAVPPEMVRVTLTKDDVRLRGIGALDDYWIDRFETTNRQFQEFVDQGGYARREFWRETFVDGPLVVTWEEAMARFRDTTGQPGPATWKSGRYPDGEADFPVGGVSWYEASAYAEFAGKRLPTMYHWYGAAALGRFADILMVSNFDGKAPVAVGSRGGLGPFGTYDMAGNVKEWCSTATGATDGGRFLLGGAWNEPRYMFADYDARGPFEREPSYGFRLAKYLQPLSPEVSGPVRVDVMAGGRSRQEAVSDDMFAVYLRQYAYDRKPLAAVVEASEETDNWRLETIEVDAAYGGERMRLFLFLPRDVSSPYQTVIFFPAADAFNLRSSRDMSVAWVRPVLSSGRAFLYPVYKGTYERGVPEATGPIAQRELRIAWSRDLGRAIDYLETRSDVDRARLAFFGVSAGAGAGMYLTAVEPRLKASVLQGAGMWAGDAGAPEGDPVNYVTRIRLPTLLLNGRYDFESPLETSQRPLFDLLGTPAEDKRHAVFERGHAVPLDDVERELLGWFDRYLGPVARPSFEAR